MGNDVLLKSELLTAVETLVKYKQQMQRLAAQGYWGTPRYVIASELASNTEDYIEYLQTRLSNLGCDGSTHKSNKCKSNKETTMNIHNNVAETQDSLALNELRHQQGIHQDLIQEVLDELSSFEYNPSDEEYDAWLDEIYEPVTLGYSTWDASRVIKEMSPTDYRSGRIDFIDGVDITDLDEYKEIAARVEELGCELDAINEQIAELEDELEDDEGTL